MRNYIGTSWEVLDDCTIEFTENLYAKCLSKGSAAGKELGEAMQIARQRLFDKRDEYGVLWLAYQHYGDPQLMDEVQVRGTM